MSAYVLDKSHIDVMVTAGIDSMPRLQGSPLRWWWWCGGVGDDAMRRSESLRLESADRVGQMLWNENHVSVNHRYSEETKCPTYTYSPKRGFEPVAVLKAIDCYEYQSCEHGGWDTSEARAFCDALRRRMIQLLPGYNDAAWSIDDDGVGVEEAA